MLARAFTLIFSEPIILVIDLYTALLYGVLYVWFESFPLVFGGIYQFSIGQQGLVFLGIFVGALVTVPCYMLWLRWYLVPSLREQSFKPEGILVPTFFGAIALPLCLFWFGWTSNPAIHWIVPIVGSGFFTVSIVTLFSPTLNYLGMAYPQYAASVFAGNALFRASFGVVFPSFCKTPRNHCGLEYTVLTLCLGTCIIPKTWHRPRQLTAWWAVDIVHTGTIHPLLRKSKNQCRERALPDSFLIFLVRPTYSEQEQECADPRLRQLQISTVLRQILELISHTVLISFVARSIYQGRFQWKSYHLDGSGGCAGVRCKRSSRDRMRLTQLDQRQEWIDEWIIYYSS